MNKVYTRINWENYPSTKTELDAENLNTIDYAVNEMDNRIIEQDTSKANKTELSNLIKDWNMDESTGIITVTKHNGSTIMFDLNIEKIPVSFSLSDDGILTMETDDGTKFTANIGAMIPILTFNESDDIAVSVEGTGINKTYTFSLKNGAVTEEKLQPNYLANIKVEVANANAYSQAASNAAITSQSWAVGGTDSRENEDSNNAKYWAEQARTASGIGIASTSTAGKVLATNDVNVDSTGAMSIGTDFVVPEGLTNLASGSDWNVILGQLAKLVEDYIDEKLNGYSTAGDVIAKSGSSPISMSSLKEALDDKAEAITGGISTYAYNNFPADRVLRSDYTGKLFASNITSAELGHLTGVTGNIQAQFNNIVNGSLKNQVVSLLNVQQSNYTNVVESHLMNFITRNGVCSITGTIYVASPAESWVTVSTAIPATYVPKSTIYIAVLPWVRNTIVTTLDVGVMTDGTVRMRAGAQAITYYVHISW